MFAFKLPKSDNKKEVDHKVKNIEKKVNEKLDILESTVNKKIDKVENKIVNSQAKISDLDKKIVQVQKSTRTLFKAFEKLHNWLRTKSKVYYNWHLQPYADLTHWVIVIVAFLVAVFLVGYQLGFFGAKKPSSHAATGIPKMVNYQGKLTDLDNFPVADGAYNMNIRIFDAETGGSCLWAWKGSCGSPTSVSVSVTNGIFSVLLGDTTYSSTNALNLDFASDTYFLSVQVGSDPEMVPRKRIGAVGYAYNSDTVDGKHETDFALLAGRSGGQTLIGGTNANDVLTVQGNSASSGNTGTNAAFQLKVGNSGGTTALIVLNNGNVGIGTVSPSTLLQLGTPGTTAGVISLAGSTAGLLTLQSAANFTPYSMTLPSSGGTSGYVMQTDGAGITSWVDPLTLSGMYWTRNSGSSYLYNSDYSTDRVFVGLNGPNVDTQANSTLVVNNKIEVYRPDASTYSEIVFTNTAGSGDFRIYGDGNDIYWQGGGGRSLQMGSWWTTIISGDTQTITPPAFTQVANISLLVLSSRTASVTLVARGMAAQTADLQQWQDSASNVLAKVDISGNFGIGNSTATNEGRMTIRSAGSATIPMIIEDSSGTNILEAKDMSTNFGMSVDTGAFMDRNSAIQEEFNKNRTTLTSDTTGNQGTGMGDGGGWGVYETGSCTFSTVADTVNGILRFSANTDSDGCLVMMDEALNNRRDILDADNLPVFMMKIRPSNISATNTFFTGMFDATDGTITDPANFIGFTNNGGTTWTGRTTLAGTSTNVTCTGQTISTANFALLKIEVRANNNVRFFVDNNVSNGISFTECGTGSSTNIPTTNLAPEMMYQCRAGGTTGAYLDVDFYRVWQDDSIINVTEKNNEDKSELPISEMPIKEDSETDLYQISDESKIDEHNADIIAKTYSLDELQKQFDISKLNISTNIEEISDNFASQITDLKKQIGVLETNIDAIIMNNEKNIQGNVIGNIDSDTLVVKNKMDFLYSIKFEKKVSVSKDQAGIAKILAGDKKVNILYEETYEDVPIVVATPKAREAFNGDISYYISNETLKGFSINISSIQKEDIEFNWHALGVIDGVETSSDNTKVKINIEYYLDIEKSQNNDPIINVVY